MPFERVVKTWVNYKGCERTYIMFHGVNRICTSMIQYQIKTCVTDMNQTSYNNGQILEKVPGVIKPFKHKSINETGKVHLNRKV